MTRVVLLTFLMMLNVAALAAQVPIPERPFRPYLYVLFAFAAGWVLVGAWVLQISRKVKELARRVDEAGAP